MPAGRPSTYDPKYCDEVVRWGRLGKSLEQISAEINIPRTTMLSWADVHPEFSTALARAKELEQAWWEDVGQNALFADKFQNAVWSKSVAARFRDKYTERQVNEHTGKDGGPIEMSPVEAGQKTAFMLQKAAHQIKKVGPSDQ